MPWSGQAAVHVSLVNWIKGAVPPSLYTLAIQKGNDKNGPWDEYQLPIIPASLRPTVDVTGAETLQTNLSPKVCYQGQTNGHAGFLLNPDERAALLRAEPAAEEVTFPFLIAEDMIGRIDSLPSRYVIDFQPRDIF